MLRALVQHAVAGGVVVASCVGLTIVAYFALLLWAMLTNSGLGGPLALPGMVIMALVAATAAVAIVLLPVTVLARFVCRSVERRRWPIEIGVATLLLVVWVIGAAFAIGAWRGNEPMDSLKAGAIATVPMLVLLGVYWWSARATGWLLRVVTLRARRSSSGA